jgi:hypothetical protein
MVLFVVQGAQRSTKSISDDNNRSGQRLPIALYAQIPLRSGYLEINQLGYNDAKLQKPRSGEQPTYGKH